MKYSLILFTFFILTGCANMVTPSGGKKDETIPELKRTNLKPTEFNEKQIKLEFDENIQVENGLKTITIQPKHSTFTILTTAKTIRIVFDSSLNKNTTYILNIAGGIKDMNEGNIYSMNYIFSTGPNIDTNFINYKISNFKDQKNLKLGLSMQTVDSVQKLKFDYLYPITSNFIAIKGLGLRTYYCWIFTDKNGDDIPDEYSPIYYDTISINQSKDVALNKWTDNRNINNIQYKRFTKIFKPIADIGSYGLKNAIYVDKDSSLFNSFNNDTLPPLDYKKELKDKINSKIFAIKTLKEYLIIIDKCGITNLSITDKLNFKEDENYFYINSKFKIDSVNFKHKQSNDSITFYSKKLTYEESSKISTLKLLKNNISEKIIMAVYQNEKLISIKKINRKNDVVFYMQPGTYKIVFFNTEFFKNTTFDLNNLSRINCKIIEKEITLKPNWDEAFQLIF